MSRRKKTEEEVITQQPVEPTETEVAKEVKKPTGIGYGGKVSVSILNANKKVIKKKVYHNAGGNELFKFLCYSVACDIGNARLIKPEKIKLMFNDASSPKETSYNLKSMSPCITADSKTALMDYIEGFDDKIWTVNLHFLVPAAVITAETNAEINEIRLYPTNTEADKEDVSLKNVAYCAKFQFLNDDGEWDPITVQTDRNSYNVMIDWTLYFTNINSEEGK